MLNGQELRRSPRRNTAIIAFIIFADGRQIIDCIIRNVSDGGAKLEVASVSTIPNTFQLVTPGQRPQSCRVAWRALREIGVQFVQ